MNIFPAIKVINELLNPLYVRVADLKNEISEKLNNEKHPEEYHFDDFLLNFNNFATISHYILGKSVKRIEEEIKANIKRKIATTIDAKNALNELQNKITQYPLSFNIKSNLIRISLYKEDLSQIKQTISEKYHSIYDKISKKFSPKSNLKLGNTSEPTKDSETRLQKTENDLDQVQNKPNINQTQNKPSINQPQYRVEIKKTTMKIEKEITRDEEPEEKDYEKLMKRDELRRKLEARKKVSINKSKIEKDLEGARRR